MVWHDDSHLLHRQILSQQTTQGSRRLDRHMLAQIVPKAIKLYSRNELTCSVLSIFIAKIMLSSLSLNTVCAREQVSRIGPVCQRQFALILGPGKQRIFNYNVYSFSCQLCNRFIEILLFSCFSIFLFFCCFCFVLMIW